MKSVQEGDTLVVGKLDRLARSVRQLIDTVEALREKGATFRSLTEALETTTPQGRLVFHAGRWTGRSSIRGGRADVRQALYMPALAAARDERDMKAKYAHLIKAGKPAKVALTAIMRKLVVLANALAKANRPCTPRTA